MYEIGVLLIGGPADGRRVRVESRPDGSPIYDHMRVIADPGPALTLGKKPAGPISYTTEVYKFEQMREADQVYFVGVHTSTRGIMAAMIRGYRQEKNPC